MGLLGSTMKKSHTHSRVQSPLLRPPPRLPLHLLLLHLCAGIGPIGPRGLDQLFESRVSRVFQRSDLDVTHSLAGALE